MVKNRLHLDIHVSGGRVEDLARSPPAGSESTPRPGGWPISGPRSPDVLSEDGLDHYAVGMKDPEGNEFDIN